MENEKLGWDHECVHKEFATEANDILIDMWFRKMFDGLPSMKERVAKLLGDSVKV